MIALVKGITRAYLCYVDVTTTNENATFDCSGGVPGACFVPVTSGASPELFVVDNE